MLRGHCRHFGQSIAPRYFTVELLTAALWVICGIWLSRFPDPQTAWPWLLQSLLLVSSLVAIFYIDLDHYIIPNVIVLPVAVIGLAASIAISLTGDMASFCTQSSCVYELQPWWAFPLAGLASALFFLVVAMAKPGGMGMGDMKLAGMLGFFLGKAVLVALFLGFLIGAVTGVLLMAAGIKGRQSRIPFGPFLAAGAVIALFYGVRLLELWTGLFQA